MRVHSIRLAAIFLWVACLPSTTVAQQSPRGSGLMLQELCDLAEMNPNEAFAMVARSGETDKNRWISYIVIHLAERHPDVARLNLSRLKRGVDRDWALKAVAQSELKHGDAHSFTTCRMIDSESVRAESLAAVSFESTRRDDGQPGRAALAAARESLTIALKLRGSRAERLLPTVLIPLLVGILPSEVRDYVTGIQPEWWYGTDGECRLHRAGIWSFIDRDKSDRYFQTVPDAALKDSVLRGCMGISIDNDLKIYVVGLARTAPELAADQLIRACSLAGIQPKPSTIHPIDEMVVREMIDHMAKLVALHSPGSRSGFVRAMDRIWVRD